MKTSAVIITGVTTLALGLGLTLGTGLGLGREIGTNKDKDVNTELDELKEELDELLG